MEFIRLQNFNQMLKLGANTSSPAFIDINGNSKTLSNSYVDVNATPFRVKNGNNTSASSDNIFPNASSAENIPFNTTSIPSPITTTTTVTGVLASDKVTQVISFVGSEEATIRHIVFTKGLKSGTTTYNSVIWALKLDNPVELNAANNYTANFTFSIKFD